jgi:hypothetical protein
MRIAFDLDNTLIRCGFEFPVERLTRSRIGGLLGFESLRRDTTLLFLYLKKSGCAVWIYTTSYRSHWYIRFLFLVHGIWLDGVVNQKDHEQRMRTLAIRCSKYPPAFNIDVLVDDSAGVAREGETFSFNVVVIDPENENWIDNVKALFGS